MKNNNNLTNFEELERQKSVFKRLMNDEKFVGYLYRVSRSYGGDAYGVVDDALQDMFEVVYNKLWGIGELIVNPEKSIEKQIKAYIIVTVKNKTWNYLKKSLKRVDREDIISCLIDCEDDFVQRYKYHKELLEALSKQQKQVLLFLAAGKSYKEIAKLTGLKVGAVSSVIRGMRDSSKDFLRCADEFEKYKNGISEDQFYEISEKTGVHKRTTKRFYNCWINSKD